ncbi:MAG: hypothetical protein MJ105_07645 [Lachnospiraceae bacterium]|nr:hypothetical protein [Lachnospiraceae bacterium]
MSTNSFKQAQKNAALVRKDKVDKLNTYKNMRSNFIKWWNVKVQSDEESTKEDVPEDVNLATVDVSAIADDRERDAIANALALSNRSNIFAELMDAGIAPEVVEEDSAEADALMEEANAIFARLQAEAAADEAAKAAEIEALKSSMGV